LDAGAPVAQIVGYEADRTFDNGATPPGTVVLAEHPLVDVLGRASQHDLTIYTAPSGASVLGAGSIEWSWGLSAPGVADARIQRMTSNFFAAASVLPATPQSLSVNQNAWSRANTSGAAQEVVTVAGIPGVHGSTDGAAMSSTFDRPSSVAIGGDGTIYVADAAAHRVRQIRNGVVS